MRFRQTQCCGLLRRYFYLPAIAFVLGLGAIDLRANEPKLRIGFVVTHSRSEKLPREAAAALELAQRLVGATPVWLDGGGKFVDAQGATANLSDFAVVWLHEGDTSEQTSTMIQPETVAVLRDFVAGGRGLFLSGAALALVQPLGVETVTPRVGAAGNDRYTAALVALDLKHPVFKNLSCEGSIARITDAGYPAFADFYGTGGPRGGMLLARAQSGSENPLVEYELGKGRIIALGWRLPHYSHVNNTYRANLTKLTANILGYLADADAWQPVVVRTADELIAKKDPGVPDEQWRALRMAISDLSATFSDRYPRGNEFLRRVDQLRNSHDELLAKGGELDKETKHAIDTIVEEFHRLRQESLLANPLLDFDRLLVVKRSEKNLGLPMNWQGNSCLPKSGYDNEIAVLSPLRPDSELKTLFRPEGERFVGDVELHFDADRLMFSMPGRNGAWQVCEMRTDGAGLHELPLVPDADVNNYDACYLPDGNIIFCSTAPMVGVPCVTGSSHVGNLFLYEPATGNIRQLTFEQDHDWCPTVLNNGRVLYLRWEYSDLPHFVSRILFHMNPDGTEQMEYYGSSSYWPNAMFYARPVPNHPTKFVAIVGGHHDVPRMGELVLFDPAKGQREADGVVQRIPGHGKKVEPIILDGLVGGSWPKFLNPWPLSDKYFLVSAKPAPQAKWGIYLVDVFDNMLLLKEQEGYALLEPTPIRPRPRPPVVSSRVETTRNDATVHITDIYSGPGLAGIPRGTVKKLRLFTYHFAYHGVGGQVHRVGLDGPWDVKRVLGTVPVEADGSAYFHVPANTPISVQPLDAEGKAVQLMRSWMTAMPGERVSCVGCHDRQNGTGPNRSTLAQLKPPTEITPWYGTTRGFSFEREVQPVLDRHCIGCHDGQTGPSGEPIVDLRNGPPVQLQAASQQYNQHAKFTPPYLALRSLVRAPTIESDMHLLTPGEFHADTTKLVQLLRKGHYGVQLDAEGWDRLITWIDLNTPAHGAWSDILGIDYVARQRDRRREMMNRYAGRDEDPESIAAPSAALITAVPVTSVAALPTAKVTDLPQCPDWPFDTEEAVRRQRSAGEVEQVIELGSGVKLELVRIPAGQFVMGDPAGHPDEQPPTLVRVGKPLWIGRYEITNEQYRLFDPTHDSGLEEGDFLQFSQEERGYSVNGPRQPVVRVSWQEAIQFCEWLSKKTRLSFDLPAEAQWEYACRAGTNTPLFFGGLNDDFTSSANLADASLHAVDLYGWGLPIGAIPPWRPADSRFNDRFRVSAPVGTYRPNAWGLHDMHGNVAEWTRSRVEPYPHADSDGRNNFSVPQRMVVRGGSWDDRPDRARSAFRLSYWPHQKVYDVGFRVVCATSAQ